MQGRVIEIYGPEASGKTTLALHVIAEAQRQGGLSILYFTAMHSHFPLATSIRTMKSKKRPESRNYGHLVPRISFVTWLYFVKAKDKIFFTKVERGGEVDLNESYFIEPELFKFFRNKLTRFEL